MDGLLIVDKPSGPTSHDVVAIVRRLLGTRAGHTGTLDPMACGVLPVLVGRATRLAQFMSGADKTYDATVPLGVSTDTCDALGRQVGPVFEGRLPDIDALEEALARFRGVFEQQPPAYSAKKISGRPSYALARRARDREAVEAPPIAPTLPAPVRVAVYNLDITGFSGTEVMLQVRCSAGFYVRALAHDLGAALGTGAHLSALRRTAVAGVEGTAVPLADFQDGKGKTLAIDSLVPMGALLPHLPALTLVANALPRIRAGRDVAASDASAGFHEAAAAVQRGTARHVRLLDPAGDLTAIAEASPTPGLLHPCVVLM